MRPTNIRAALLLAAVAFACVHGCSVGGSSATSLAITEAVQRGEARLDISALSPGEWDRLFVFAPYTDEEEVMRELGFQWGDFRRSSIQSSDRVSLLVFTEGVRVVEWFDHPRSMGDFSGLWRPGGYSRQESVFSVEYAGEEMWPVVSLFCLKKNAYTLGSHLAIYNTM